MATKLQNDVKRELMFTLVEFGKYRGRGIIVTLEAGDVIRFRVKGTRQAVSISLSHCMQLANIVSMEQMYKEALQKYAEKKKTGQRARRPKRPANIFSKIYYKALKK